MLGSLEEVAALYRSCDIGLVFMHTKHPSYQPFEFMASGMATVSNINPATTWLLRDGENCLLTPPLPTPTAERLGRLIDDPELRQRIARAGGRADPPIRWEDQIERIWDTICLAEGTSTWPRRQTPLELLGDPRRLAGEHPQPEHDRCHRDPRRDEEPHLGAHDRRRAPPPTPPPIIQWRACWRIVASGLNR